MPMCVRRLVDCRLSGRRDNQGILTGGAQLAAHLEVRLTQTP